MKFRQTMLVLALASGFTINATAASTDATFSSGQKAQIENITKDYLLKNPTVIVDSIKNMQEKQFEEMRHKAQQVATKEGPSLFNNAADPIAGNAKGTVTVVEFFDYQCPHCVEMVPTINDIIKNNAEVRVVYKEFPIRGPVSQVAAKAALAANLQGKYVSFHEELMKNAATLTPASIEGMAKSLNLDMVKFKADMDGAAVDAQIKATYKLAQDLELAGTPALFIAKTDADHNVGTNHIEFIPGQVDKAALQSIIDKAKK